MQQSQRQTILRRQEEGVGTDAVGCPLAQTTLETTHEKIVSTTASKTSWKIVSKIAVKTVWRSASTEVQSYEGKTSYC